LVLFAVNLSGFSQNQEAFFESALKKEEKGAKIHTNKSADYLEHL